MKKMMATLTLISICVSLFAFQFRNNEWGASQNEVMRSEGKEPVEKNNTALSYEEVLDNMECMVLYQFLNNELYTGAYLFINEHSNKTLYIIDYKELKKLLIKKYGNPIKDKIKWGNDLYKDDPSSWGTAIAIGHLWYESKWKIDNTSIQLILSGDNYKINMGIVYINEQTNDKVKEVESKKIEDKL